MGVSLKPIKKNQYSEGIVIPEVPKPRTQKPIEPPQEQPKVQQAEVKPIPTNTNQNTQTYNNNNTPSVNQNNTKSVNIAPIIDYEEPSDEIVISPVSNGSSTSRVSKSADYNNIETSVLNQEGKTAEFPSYTTSNNKEGINFHVSGDNAKITINHYTHPQSLEGVTEEAKQPNSFEVLVQETLDIKDEETLKGVEEKIQYLNRLLDAKKTLFEAQDKYGNKG